MYSQMYTFESISPWFGNIASNWYLRKWKHTQVIYDRSNIFSPIILMRVSDRVFSKKVFFSFLPRHSFGTFLFCGFETLIPLKKRSDLSREGRRTLHLQLCEVWLLFSPKFRRVTENNTKFCSKTKTDPIPRLFFSFSIFRRRWSTNKWRHKL